jgi:hypothetical protein
MSDNIGSLGRNLKVVFIALRHYVDGQRPANLDNAAFAKKFNIYIDRVISIILIDSLDFSSFGKRRRTSTRIFRKNIVANAISCLASRPRFVRIDFPYLILVI